MKLAIIFAFAVAMATPALAQDELHPDMEAAAAMYARACAQCHGRTGRGMASFPSLTEREDDYIAARLMQYRAGETVGPNSPLMKPVAARLSDDDIANLAAFVSASFR